MHKNPHLIRPSLLSVVLIALLLIFRGNESAWGKPTSPWQDALGSSRFAPQYTGCGGDFTPVVNATFEQQVIDLTNKERAARGLPPLKRVSALDEASRYHAADQARDRYESHDTYDRVGDSLKFVCGTFYRISYYYTEWLSATENLAGGQTTPKEAMRSWMTSPGHKANILSAEEWEIGVGYYYGANNPWGHYWVQEFGRRQGRYPLIINREAARTDSPNVSLYIYGSWNEMRLSNDGVNWTAWQPFQNEMSWNLGRGIGTHTVHARLRKGSQTVTSKDTIELTSEGEVTAPTLGGLPDALTFYYSIPVGNVTPPRALIAPINIGDEQALTWKATSGQTWLGVTPNQGTTPAALTIIPIVTNLDTTTPKAYSDTVTLSVVDPTSEVSGSPHTIDVTLIVMNTPPRVLFMPMVAK